MTKTTVLPSPSACLSERVRYPYYPCWVYQGGDCGLDVFFFLDMATSDERVLTVAPNSQPATTAAPAAASSESQSASAGQPAASAAVDAAAISEGTAVDACYGKLRRS